MYGGHPSATRSVAMKLTFLLISILWLIAACVDADHEPASPISSTTTHPAPTADRAAENRFLAAYDKEELYRQTRESAVNVGYIICRYLDADVNATTEDAEALLDFGSAFTHQHIVYAAVLNLCPEQG